MRQLVIRFFRHLRSRELRRSIQTALRDGPVEATQLARDHWRESLENPVAFYLKCFRFFHFQIPDAIRKHREYFAAGGRGFGEDAFHTMWFLLQKEFGLRQFLEIGVYRGQVLSLISLLQQTDGKGGSVTGISPFSPAGDSVSRYMGEIDYLEDTRGNFRAFKLPEPQLLKAYSTDANAVDTIRSRAWDCVYIDGNHDYEVARMDWIHASAAVRQGGLIIFDDSALTTSFVPPRFASKGHPGPSRLAAETEKNSFAEILQVGHNRVFQKIS